MTTQYTPILQLALPVTGELNGTWGDVVNDNITSMVEQAIAGLATINTWTANSHTLTTADGTTDEARCAMLVAATGSGGTALSAAGKIICPARTKLFVLQNSSAYQVTLKTASGTGIAVAAGDTAFLFCDGTNVNACVTQIINGHITGNLTVDGNATVNGNTTLGNATSDTITATARIASDLNPSADNTYDLGTSGNSWRNLFVDTTATIATTIGTNLQITNLKANDGTAAGSIANSTGVVTLNSSVLTTTDINGGTIDGTTIGGATPAAGTFTTAAATTGNITTVNATTVDTTNIEVTNLKAKDGTAAGSIADSTGVVTLNSSVLTTTDINGGTIDGTTIGGSTPAAGTFTTAAATTGNITTVNATTVDTTNIEVTNVKAKDGTAGMVIADSTGDVSFSSTGALTVSKGTTGQQPGSPTTGMMRYNSTTNQFEGYSGASPAWKSIGGSALSNDTSTSSNLYPVFAAATTGTAENLYTSNAKYLYKPSTGELQSAEVVASNGIFVNSQTVSANYTIPVGSSAMSAGPVAVASGVTVTVSSGSRWVIQ